MITAEDIKDKIENFAAQFFTPEELSRLIIKPLVSDASLRRYYELQLGDKKYILMDCPVSYTSIKPFIDIDLFLKEQGFSVPKILHYDIDQGLMITEHFGYVDIKKYLVQATDDQSLEIYKLMIDLLIDLHNNTNIPDNLEIMSNERLIEELDLYLDFYIPYKYGTKISGQDRQEFQTIWQGILHKQKIAQQKIVLRDYHVENIMHLADRKDIKSLGLLDFQDATLGSPVYDIVSLLEDARTQVGREFALSMLKYYTDKTQYDYADINVDYHILGAQRNSRILGVFTRKFLQDEDDRYLQFLPRVEQYLEYDLSHPVLKPFRDWQTNL